MHDLWRDCARTLAATDPAADNARAAARPLDHCRGTADRVLGYTLLRAPPKAHAGAVCWRARSSAVRSPSVQSTVCAELDRCAASDSRIRFLVRRTVQATSLTQRSPNHPP